MNNKNDHDIYIIPPNFIETGTILGGMFKIRNAIEAGILAVAIGVPVFLFVPMGLTARIILSQGLIANLGKATEQDAAEPDGTPVLFAYSCDLPRIVRFNTSLELTGRTGTLICFDFQADTLRRFCGDRVRFQTIDFEKFEGRFFP